MVAFSENSHERERRAVRVLLAFRQGIGDGAVDVGRAQVRGWSGAHELLVIHVGAHPTLLAHGRAAFETDPIEVVLRAAGPAIGGNVVGGHAALGDLQAVEVVLLVPRPRAQFAFAANVGETAKDRAAAGVLQPPTVGEAGHRSRILVLPEASADRHRDAVADGEGRPRRPPRFDRASRRRKRALPMFRGPPHTLRRNRDGTRRAKKLAFALSVETRSVPLKE